MLRQDCAGTNPAQPKAETTSSNGSRVKGTNTQLFPPAFLCSAHPCPHKKTGAAWVLAGSRRWQLCAGSGPAHRFGDKHLTKRLPRRVEDQLMGHCEIQGGSITTVHGECLLLRGSESVSWSGHNQAQPTSRTAVSPLLLAL